MWKYKSGEYVKIGDHVLISQAMANRLKTKREGIVVGLQGFVTVRLSDGGDYDFDMRSLKLHEPDAT